MNYKMTNRRQIQLTVLFLIMLAHCPLAAMEVGYSDWDHSGSMWLVTTTDGAAVAAGSVVAEFPVLVRLSRDWFDFSQAGPQGEDIRFALMDGKPLSFQIEQWDASAGQASIWVRVPSITGNSQQELRMFWGNANAESESRGDAVFNTTNGYLSVWHMGDLVHDEVGTLESTDTGTTPTSGMIGGARNFPGQKGVFCGDQIITYPTEGAVHSTQAWFRPKTANGRVLGWGNEKAQGKVIMEYRSPPKVRMECYFSDANVDSDLPRSGPEWIQAVHTYQRGHSLIYLNGELAGEGNPNAAPLAIERPARMWIGGWYNSYDFIGDIDEVRVSNVIRSAAWIRLEYENQKPLQSLVGPLVQSGSEFAVSERSLTIAEGTRASISASAGGARKVYWVLKRGERESIVAVDRFHFTLDAGRVTGDQPLTLQFKAVYANEMKTIDVPVMIKEQIPEPRFTLQSPSNWDGRETIEIAPHISNLAALKASDTNKLTTRWTVSGLAVIKQVAEGKLVLHRAQNSGEMTVTASISNGGEAVTATTTINVREPAHDAWVQRVPEPNEKPVDNQFYARDVTNKGTMYCNGTLEAVAEAVRLNVYADEQLFNSASQKPDMNQTYAFTVKLKPGLIKYRVELSAVANGVETVLHKAENIVCGDAFVIDGQSNALATDTGDKSPLETNPWIRSYGEPSGNNAGQNLWCNPVWKASNGEPAELGYWGMELAKRLLTSQQVPIFMINGAVGGTRIDQHQRHDEQPTDLDTIYGRLLWRVREAKLTHGIRAILWHQGENDQGADGPDGGYGWETYQNYFIEMSADWKQDFPNVQRYYVFQIWPNACSMGNGNGDMLREVQRQLPQLYSNMKIMSTLGITPPGGCHYPLEGWAEFARLIEPVMEQDLYGRQFTASITPPNLLEAYFTDVTRSAISLTFDQPIDWNDELLNDVYLNRESEMFIKGSVSKNTLTLQLKLPADAVSTVTYLKEMSWNPSRLLRGTNGIAALSFCEVAVEATP